MSFHVKRKIIRDDIATAQIYEEHIADYQVLRRHIATGQLHEEHIADYQILRRHIATGAIHEEHFSKTREISSGKSIASGIIYKEHLRFVEITTDPLPDTDTEIAFGITFTDSDGNPITPLGGAFPTTAGVAGYVMEATRSATSITLRASVSGVVAKVIVFG